MTIGRKGLQAHRTSRLLILSSQLNAAQVYMWCRYPLSREAVIHKTFRQLLVAFLQNADSVFARVRICGC